MSKSDTKAIFLEPVETAYLAGSSESRNHKI